ncbi:hypothetical protein P3342_006051 [Pyrenophora teres f. teres]|nr:hypothetical protein P3342_006051 [Pyrenophora teres f. teres]
MKREDVDVDVDVDGWEGEPKVPVISSAAGLTLRWLVMYLLYSRRFSHVRSGCVRALTSLCTYDGLERPSEPTPLWIPADGITQSTESSSQRPSGRCSHAAKMQRQSWG